MSLTIVSCLCLALFAACSADTDTSDNNVEASPRILGGANANINEFPYQVSLRKSGRHFCGGSIVGERHILTAAHCVRDIMRPPYSDIVVVTGSTMSVGSGGKSHRVKRADIHHGYTGTEQSSYRNDVAVLTLQEAIKFDGNQRKIELASHEPTMGSPATVSGWGLKQYPSSNTSPQLQKAQMSLIPASSCLRYLQPLRVYGEQVCALQRAGVGACSGDSGGPLTANNEVVGIASWVVPCGKGYPDVYTNVYAYRSWIKSIIAKP